MIVCQPSTQARQVQGSAAVCCSCPPHPAPNPHCPKPPPTPPCPHTPLPPPTSPPPTSLLLTSPPPPPPSFAKPHLVDLLRPQRRQQQHQALVGPIHHTATPHLLQQRTARCCPNVLRHHQGVGVTR
jgi:hypothetical protein